MVNLNVFCLCIISVLLSKVVAFDYSQVVFVILSQSGKRHEQISAETKLKLTKNLQESGVEHPLIYDLNNDFKVRGGWTIFPLMPELEKASLQNAKWFLFLNEASEVNLDVLSTILLRYPSDYGIFLGNALRENEVDYPDPLAGFVISKELLSSLSTSNQEYQFLSLQTVTPDANFILSICARYLASYMEDEPLFCTSYAEGCATYPRDTKCSTSIEAATELVKKTLFAIRTCKVFHGDRLQVIRKTWSDAAYNMLVVSDEEDAGNGTITLPGGDIDLCHRHLAILKYFLQNYQQNDWRWLVIGDDDTLLGVSKMMDLLQCYDDFTDELLAVGERYGYRVSSPNSMGYDFLSGGGGIILNRNLVGVLYKTCSCPRPDPSDRMDDVHLGACIADIKVKPIHTERMHQRRTIDYSPKLLARQDPISFHKFHGIDPLEVYNTYFREGDEYFKELKLSKQSKTEL